MATRTPGMGRLSGFAAVLLIAAVAASACTTAGATAATTSAPTIGPSSNSTAATHAASPTVAGACPAVTTSLVSQSAPDGLWTVSFKKPVVSGVPAAVATAINDAINARVASFVSDFNGGELGRRDDGLPNTLVGDFAVGLCTSRLLGLRFLWTVDLGGAHPTDLVGSINFVVATGATIHLADLFTSTAAALPVLGTARDLLVAAEPDLADPSVFFWPTSPAMNFYEHAWWLTTAGVYLGWDMGDIAPTVFGIVSTTVPWATLHPVLNPSGPAGMYA